MKAGRFAMRLGYTAIAVLVVVGFWPSGAQAQDGGTQALSSHRHSPTENHRAGPFVKLVRDVTRQFLDVSVALGEGFEPRFGCVSGSHEGAMGVHLVNFPLVADGVLDPAKPELLVYEPTRHGGLRLVAADYLVDAAAWHANNEAPPELMGQLFHLFEAPNRFGLAPFYTLHVWAWKENPQGTFANWNPDVSCDNYTGGQQ